MYLFRNSLNFGFILGQPAAEIATPKNSKTYSFTENTPYKEDLLICSQHFDPQQDVGWDCRSPDAVNFLRKSILVYLHHMLWIKLFSWVSKKKKLIEKKNDFSWIFINMFNFIFFAKICKQHIQKI